MMRSTVAAFVLCLAAWVRTSSAMHGLFATWATGNITLVDPDTGAQTSYPPNPGTFGLSLPKADCVAGTIDQTQKKLYTLAFNTSSQHLGVAGFLMHTPPKISLDSYHDLPSSLVQQFTFTSPDTIDYCSYTLNIDDAGRIIVTKTDVDKDLDKSIDLSTVEAIQSASIKLARLSLYKGEGWSSLATITNHSLHASLVHASATYHSISNLLWLGVGKTLVAFNMTTGTYTKGPTEVRVSGVQYDQESLDIFALCDDVEEEAVTPSKQTLCSFNGKIPPSNDATTVKIRTIGPVHESVAHLGYATAFLNQKRAFVALTEITKEGLQPTSHYNLIEYNLTSAAKLDQFEVPNLPVNLVNLPFVFEN